MIDAHHHFWRYNPQEYDWISDEMALIRRDFEPQHLKSTIKAAGVDGVVSVQARQNLDETRWLLNLARENKWIRGVVGWLPLASPEIESVLEQFSGESHLKSVRHVVQGEADGFLDGAEFNAGIRLLEKFGLAYDLLIVGRQLSQAITFVDRHPNQAFVLDHIAKPLIKEAILKPWETEIFELARREHVFCKVSGMVTEADWHSWTPDGLRPYFDVVLEAFGAERLMFGSDWPVCEVACPYLRWVRTVREWAMPLSTEEKQDLFKNTVRRAYTLP